MDSNQLHAPIKENKKFESYLPTLSLITVFWAGFGLIFVFYYFFIKNNISLTIVFLIPLLIGILTGFFIETKMRKIETVEKDVKRI